MCVCVCVYMHTYVCVEIGKSDTGRFSGKKMILFFELMSEGQMGKEGKELDTTEQLPLLQRL